MEELTTQNMLSQLSQEQGQFYCSFSPNDIKGKKQLFKIMTTPDKKLSDMINMEINVTDVFCEVVSMASETTGEITETVRVVLIDSKGVSYQCVSQGIFNAIKRLFAIFGPPTWEEGIKLKVIQINKKERSILSLEIV